jgi:hypothetical protein
MFKDKSLFSLNLPDMPPMQGSNFSGISSNYKMARNDSAMRAARHSVVKFQRQSSRISNNMMKNCSILGYETLQNGSRVEILSGNLMRNFSPLPNNIVPDYPMQDFGSAARVSGLKRSVRRVSGLPDDSIGDFSANLC